ncbi:MAG: class I SAM-dependent methyltransferase, partial [Actinomycetales bacterium]
LAPLGQERGELTALLAERCEELVVSDPVAVALERVRSRGLPGVEVRPGALPHDWPEGPLDLVVISEVLYFLDEADRALTCRAAAERLEPGGHLVAVHWRHDFEEAASRPDEAHADLPATGLHRVVLHEEADFRLEVLERA